MVVQSPEPDGAAAWESAGAAEKVSDTRSRSSSEAAQAFRPRTVLMVLFSPSPSGRSTLSLDRLTPPALGTVIKGKKPPLARLEALARRRKWFSLGAVNLGNFVPPLDTGIMSLILPTISISLKAPISVVLWVPLTSLIITAAFMPIFGRFSDSHGRKRYFILGLFLFAIGAYLSGNSITIYELLIYRVVQSLGGAFILANGRALIVDAFEPRERGFALGTHISVIYIGQTIGVAITGSLVNVTQAIGWRYVFYASSSIAAIAIPLSLLALRESPKNLRIKTDWLGAVFFAGALGAALVALTTYANGLANISMYFQDIRIPFIDFYVYLNQALTIPLYTIAAVCVVSTFLFIARELTASQPLINFNTFRTNVMFASTNFSALFLYMSQYSTLILLSFYLEIIRGFTPLTAGLLLTIQPLFVTIFALFGGWIAGRTSSRDPAVAGLAIVSLSLLLLSTLSQESSTALIAVLLAMLGAGVGIFAPSNTNANLASVPPGDRALANGILGMMRHTGQSVSLAIGSIFIGLYLFGAKLSANGGTFTPAQYIAAISLSFILGAILAAVAAFFAFRGREPAGATHQIA
jgi:MFS family permease